MPRWLKILLIVMGVGILLMATCVGGATLWFRAHEDELRQSSKKMKAEGEVYGRSSTDSGCLAETKRRLDASESLLDQVGIRLFLRACLGTARPTPEFCKDAPAPDAILPTMMWLQKVCSELDAKDPQACTRTVQDIPAHCAKR
ncbi:MAG TPA: hypothetical protein VH877_19610 [Polyangia bacterium]|nr:hypothetical protein [Polyangia bacterium]